MHARASAYIFMWMCVVVCFYCCYARSTNIDSVMRRSWWLLATSFFYHWYQSGFGFFSSLILRMFWNCITRAPKSVSVSKTIEKSEHSKHSTNKMRINVIGIVSRAKRKSTIYLIYRLFYRLFYFRFWSTLNALINTKKTKNLSNPTKYSFYVSYHS